MLYGSHCWTVNEANVWQSDAVDEWCLWRILNIHWHDFVRNVDVRTVPYKIFKYMP